MPTNDEPIVIRSATLDDLEPLVALRVTLFEAMGQVGSSPYARTTEYATIAAIERDDLVAWHERFVHPNNMMLGVVGDDRSITLAGDPAQRIDPTGPVVLARLLGVAADLLSVVAVWRLGERLRPGAGLLAGAVVACAAPLVLTARLIYVEPVMTALALWSLERLDAWLAGGRRRVLVAACVLAGLAAGAKYNAGLLMIPQGLAHGSQHFFGEAARQQQDQPLEDPGRRFECVEKQSRHLYQQPPDDRISHRRTEHMAASHFQEQ